MVAIKMKMPESCDECKFGTLQLTTNKNSFMCMCNITGMNIVPSLYPYDRPIDCPLIELRKQEEEWCD